MNARDEDKRPEQIETQIEHTRAEVSATIDAIQSKFTPGQLMDQSLGYLRTSLPADFTTNLSRSIRENPVPIALVGIGLAWLMMGGQQRARSRRYTEDLEYGLSETESGIGERAAEAAASAGQRLKERAAEMSARAHDATHSVRERIGTTADSARARMSDIGQRSRERYDRARGSVNHVLEEQPLVLGAVGLAVGAVLGASLPRTRQENEWMGDARDKLFESAKARTREQADAVKEAVADDSPVRRPSAGNGQDGDAAPRHSQSAASTQTSIGNVEGNVGGAP